MQRQLQYPSQPHPPSTLTLITLFETLEGGVGALFDERDWPTQHWRPF